MTEKEREFLQQLDDLDKAVEHFEESVERFCNSFRHREQHVQQGELE